MENIVNINDKSYAVILSYIMNSVNRIIGKYYDKGYIDVCLYSKISSFFKMNDKYSLKQHKSLGVLTDLFGMNISKSADLNSILKNNPDLKPKLKLYGMDVLFYTPLDTKEDKVIKELIINHFVSRENKKYFDYSKNSIENNIIKQLELIFGEETLAMTLKNGSSYLASQIDLKCSKNGLGSSVIEYIVSISNKFERIKKLHYESDLYYNTLKRKLDTIMSIVAYNDQYKKLLLQYIEGVDFDLSSLSKKSEFRKIQLFSKKEILLIKKYIYEFDSIISSDEGEYTWLEKVTYMSNRCFGQYQTSNEALYNDWNEVNKKIIYEILPRYIKKNKKNIDLEQLIKLAPSSLKDKFKTKVVQRKVKRISK